jgi:benzoylformate decarboxylase
VSAVDHAMTVLADRGTRAIFGNPGSSELPFLNVLPPSIPYVLALQESIAVSAAAGFAMASGTPGFVNLHGMPGVGHAVGAIAGVARARVPVVILAGLPDSRHLQRRPHLSGPVAEVLAPLVRSSVVVARPEDVPDALEQAFRSATGAHQGPAFVAVPMDLWERPSRAAVTMLPADHLRSELPGWLAPLLASARRPALVIGSGLEDGGSWRALVSVAERQGADVYGSPLASAVGFPTAHPRFRSHLGLSNAVIRETLDAHDVILVLSDEPPSAYAYADGSMFPAGAEVVMFSSSQDAAILVDARRSIIGPLRGLAAALADLPARVGTLTAGAATQQAPAADPVPPSVLTWRQVFEMFAQRLPARSIVVDEAMTLATHLRDIVRTSEPRSCLRTPGGSLGFSVGAAIGAQVARPEEIVTAFVGDGGLMYAPQALWTAARYGLPTKIVVLDNGGYESLKLYARGAQMELAGNVDLDLRGIDRQHLAAAFGVPSARATDHASLAEGIDFLYGTPGPALLEVQIAT